MGVFDLFVAAVAAIGYGIGRSRGLVWQLSGIGTLLVGGLCATVLSRPLGPVFAEGILGRFAAWVVVYALVAICLYVITLRLKHRIKELEFDELDKRFGGLLGAFKGLLAFSVLTLVAVALFAPIERTVKASASGRALRGMVHELRPLLPERVHDSFGPWLDRVGEEPQPTPTPTPTPAPPVRPDPFVPEPARPDPFVHQPPASPAPPAPPPPEPESWEPIPFPEAEPIRSEPTPRATPEPLPDPFDTSRDPLDPLAPR